MSAPEPWRVVIDTDVMLAGFASATGASRRLLQAALDGRILMLVSATLLLEYEAVLKRPKNLSLMGATLDEVGLVLDEIADLCEPVLLNYRWRPVARDPNDDLVLETAINGHAFLIASFNVRDIIQGARRFGIRVERPATVLGSLRL